VSSRYPLAVIREKIFALRGEVADFAFGGHEAPLPDDFAGWARQNAALALRAAAPAEKEAFDAAAASLLAEDYGIDNDNIAILATTGGRNAMSAFVSAVLETGDSVIVTEPGYPAFARLAAQRGAVVHSVRLDPECDFSPDFSALDKSVFHDLKALYFNYPNNPTGAVLTDVIRNQIFDAATASDTPSIVFNDAIYAPLSYEGPARSLLSEDLTENPGIDVLELHSLTKLYPLGPLSMSFLSGPQRLIGRMRREFFSNRLRALRQALIDVGFEPFPAPSGLYTLCRSPSYIAGKAVASAEDAAVRLLDEFGLAVVPWDAGPDSYLRFTALYRPEDLERLAALSDRLGLNQA